MITFLTLFVSLTTGPQTIEVAVGPEVVAVELFLDDGSLGVLTGPPWSWKHDFGIELVPRELKAVATGAGGSPLGQARQLLNVPLARSGASLAVEGSGPKRWAQLRWKVLEGQEPASLALQLDGEPVPIGDPDRIELPPVEPERLHLLTAEVVFPNGETARAWATFGGSFGDRRESKVTAVPVLLPSADMQLAPGEIQGMLRGSSETLRILAVEDGPAEILLVRAPDTKDTLVRLGMGENNRGNDEPVMDPLRTMPRFLERGDRFNVLATWSNEPEARKRSGSSAASEANFFSLLINDPRLVQKGIPVLLTRGFPPVPPRVRHRLADAVAAGGRAASSEGRPRAVILVVGGSPKDHSVYSPGQVRAYLSMLRVPIAVWHIPAKKGQKPPKAWGEAADISTPNRLRKALQDLRDVVDRQRILWVEGAHLPQQVQLAAPEAPFQLLE